MSALIPEILFEIGKELVESGDSEAVLKFGLSGKEPSKALMNVFASITTLKLYENNHFAVGWDDNCFTLDSNKIPKAFVYCIGEAVKKLHIEREIEPFFQPIIDKIADKKQLTSFSAGKNSYCCNTTFLPEILPTFSSTIKNLTLPSRALLPEICASLQPQSLTLLNSFHLSFSHFFIQSSNHFFSQVKTVTFNDKTGQFYKYFSEFEVAIQQFSKLEDLHFVLEYDAFYIKRDIEALKKLIKKSNVIPQKVSYTVVSNGLQKSPLRGNYTLDTCNNICADFDYDDSYSNFYHFSQTFQSSTKQDVLFEVFVSKEVRLVSEFCLTRF